MRSKASIHLPAPRDCEPNRQIAAGKPSGNGNSDALQHNRENRADDPETRGDQQEDQLRLPLRHARGDLHPGEKAKHTDKNPKELSPEEQQQEAERNRDP